MTDDKQLRGIRLEDMLEKRRLDQALNAKELPSSPECLTQRREAGFACLDSLHFAALSSGKILSSGGRGKSRLVLNPIRHSATAKLLSPLQACRRVPRESYNKADSVAANPPKVSRAPSVRLCFQSIKTSREGGDKKTPTAKNLRGRIKNATLKRFPAAALCWRIGETKKDFSGKFTALLPHQIVNR